MTDAGPASATCGHAQRAAADTLVERPSLRSLVEEIERTDAPEAAQGRWGYRDARLEPVGNMSADEIELWTEAAREEGVA